MNGLGLSLLNGTSLMGSTIAVGEHPQVTGPA